MLKPAVLGTLAMGFSAGLVSGLFDFNDSLETICAVSPTVFGGAHHLRKGYQNCRDITLNEYADQSKFQYLPYYDYDLSRDIFCAATIGGICAAATAAATLTGYCLGRMLVS